MLLVHQICKAPVIILNLQPTAEMAYDKTGTDRWLAQCVGCSIPEISNAFNRELFETTVDLKENELMPIVSPLGYPSDNHSEVDVNLRNRVHGDERLPASELFFEGDFSTPLQEADELLEAVRWAPSAVNLQPWRVPIRSSFPL